MALATIRCQQDEFSYFSDKTLTFPWYWPGRACDVNCAVFEIGNTWGVFDDMFEEGGYKQSGVGRARGPKALEEFQEMKTRIELVAPLKP